MTATERLRALLDDRGVDWEAWNDRITVALPDTHYLEITDGTICAVMVDCTPEQAVEATLGRGTCRMELPDLRGPAYTDVYVCSECGGEVMVGTVMGVSDVPKWCPWCGRKVEQ